MDGDVGFLKHVASRVEVEILDASECASTSSGICSDIDSRSIGLLPVWQRKKSFYKEINRNSLREVSHIFLPLISLFRAASEANNNAINSISNNSISIRFKSLQDGYFILSMGDSDSQQQRFLDYFATGIQINLGPLLELIDSELVPVKSAKENIRLLLERHCKGCCNFWRDTIDVRTSTFYSKQLDKMMPILISANSQLHLFIGPNRCLLISNGQLLASANSASDDRPMWKQMRISDVQCALDQLNLLPLTNGETHLSQCWLRSSSGLIPYYVNLFRVQLTNHLQLVCLAEAKHDHLIRTVILLYDQLQQLAKQVNSESMQQHSLNEIKLTLADVEKMLLDLNLPQDETSSDRAFLRNTKKTTAFLNSLWNRLFVEISKNNEENGINMTPSSNRRFSLITIKRAISNVSLVWNNKATSQPNITVQKV
ncbi:hypothetical protein WR25_09825 [Diploscapter pachys]|uniref:Uncharacterized protein n=1 Tax=Diploscapter pachys TaxID=2018661 RepID=A0A2A2LGM7_9BILA|nr:hypothetical protein WR25_09825 [Diploscapter pachys]